MPSMNLEEVAGAKATHKFARLSASKARVVLDLIRDEDVNAAYDVLRFCERGASDEIGKVLRSAVSNATYAEGLDPASLYVAECWADEGPTLKRWRPRARGRATRINKRTCHITVVVAQLDEEELELRESARERTGGRGGGADRRARVAASRAAQSLSDDDVEEAVDEQIDDVAVDEEAVDEQIETVEEILDTAGDESVTAAEMAEEAAAESADDVDEESDS